MRIHAPNLRRSASRALAVLVTVAAATAIIASPASAHPVLSISASPTTVIAGSTVTLTISGTSNGNYTNARIEVSAGSGTGGTTGSLTSFTSSPSCGAGTPSTPTCSEITNKYKLYPINLTKNQTFSYTITFTVDSATAAGTFKGNAQFYTSGNSTIGLTTGPIITVQTGSDLVLTNSVITVSPLYGYVNVDFDVVNNGPAVTATPGTYAVSVSPAGFSSEVGGEFCELNGGAPGSNFSCELGSFTFAPNQSVGWFAYWRVSLLALGSYTLTMTVTSPNETNPSNNTLTVTCNVITNLLVTCS